MLNERSFAGVDQLSLRSLLLGILGSSVITASSMYVALRMSVLPWPTIFVAVLSMALLKSFGNTTLNEINITQTAMSAGAMVAGGLAFTLPGLWITGVWHGKLALAEHFWSVLAIALTGMLLGTVATWLLRVRFIKQAALPYPIGTAAAETISVGDRGGKKSFILFGTMGAATIFTLFRDGLGWIPSTLFLKRLYAKNLFLGFWASPMAMGIGYLIGTLYTGVWFLGAVLSYIIIIPWGPAFHWFPSVKEAISFKNTAGIGFMVGTGIGIFLDYLRTVIRKMKERRETNNQKSTRLKSIKLTQTMVFLAVLIAFTISVLSGLNPIVSVLLMLGIVASSTMAAIITGQTGINPMEIFGIIVLLVIRMFIQIDTVGAFFIAASVAVACGYSGDLLNDYQAGHLLGTNPIAQLISQIVGGTVGTVIAVLSMFAIIGQYGGVGPEKGLPAGQAFVVSQMVKGIGSPEVFWITAAIGAILFLLKMPVMTLGIGMYLPFEISSIVFLGGLVRWISGHCGRRNLTENGVIGASGLLGGEGITGVSIAIYKMFIGG